MPRFQVRLEESQNERYIDVSTNTALATGTVPAGETLFCDEGLEVSDPKQVVCVRVFDLIDGERKNGVDARFQAGGPASVNGITLEPAGSSDSSCENEEAFAREEARRAAEEAAQDSEDENSGDESDTV